ncbi:MAG TPA: hypothetical protein VNZ94_06935 [Xanthobacteraceae bacterium]|nr:hypothetical protein [Xanthobacteraceae bacterium]
MTKSRSPFRNRRRRRHGGADQRRRRSSAMPVVASVLLAGAAVALVSYLLWPTWTPQNNTEASELPVSIGNTVFNVPTLALRRKIQRHSGTQERIDLEFDYPSLQPPPPRKRVTSESVIEETLPIDAIFLSIAVSEDVVSPEERLRTIYPRYLDEAATTQTDGLTMTPFRDGSPYANEDLAIGFSPTLVARCTRDGATPGMCMSERRVEDTELTYRFPRSWLSDWRRVGDALDTLTTRLHRRHR